MAGIGFKLQKILSEKSYTASLKGYIFAAIISSGPWLFSILSMSLLGALADHLMPGQNAAIFRAMVVR